MEANEWDLWFQQMDETIRENEEWVREFNERHQVDGRTLSATKVA